MSAPVVSVVMAARNSGGYLGAAIESIQRQTLRALELVIIDDGSTDDTRRIAEGYARTDRRIIVVAQPAGGLANALNRGVELANGSWIARMDADDIAKPERLAVQLEHAVANGLQLCGCDVRTFGRAWPRVRRHYRSDRAIKLQLLFGSAFSHPAVLCRADVMRAARYDPACRSAQDYDLWTRLALAGVAMGNVAYVGLSYRIHARQVTLSPQSDQIQSALPAARRYWHAVLASELPGMPLGDRVIETLFQRSHNEDGEAADEALRLCAALARSTADPERVICDNVFKFLLRCANTWPPGARAGAFRFSALQRAALQLGRAGMLRWDTPLVQFARRRLR